MREFRSHGVSIVPAGDPQGYTILISKIVVSALTFVYSLCRGKHSWFIALLIFFLILTPASLILFALNNLKLLNSLIMRNYDVVE